MAPLREQIPPEKERPRLRSNATEGIGNRMLVSNMYSQDAAVRNRGTGGRADSARRRHPMTAEMHGPAFKRQVRHLHSLGPRATADALLAIAAGADLTATLEAWARLDPGEVAYLGAGDFTPSVFGVAS